MGGCYKITDEEDKERTLLRQIAQIEEDRMNKTAEQKEEVVKEKYIQKSNPFWARAEGASISGDTVGDPLKDTSGPSLNILIKLSSILSVVFSPLFLNTHWLYDYTKEGKATPVPVIPK